MREIKFRSYNSDEDEFDHFDLLGEFDDHAYWMLGTDNVEQYTGLKDKNGVEIYEGDILTCRFGVDFMFLVEFGGAGYRYKQLSGRSVFNGSNYISALIPLDVSIVGNIHQHPHLLEK